MEEAWLLWKSAFEIFLSGLKYRLLASIGKTTTSATLQPWKYSKNWNLEYFEKCFTKLLKIYRNLKDFKI